MAITVVEDGVDVTSDDYESGIGIAQGFLVHSTTPIDGLTALFSVKNWVGPFGTSYSSPKWDTFYSSAQLVNFSRPQSLNPDDCTWRISANYKQIPVGLINPLLEPVRKNETFDQASKIIDVDFNGRRLACRNGLPYKDPQEMKKTLTVLTYSYNTTTKPIALKNYFYATNSDTFDGNPPDSLQLLPYTSEDVYGHVVAGNYTKVQIRMLFDTDLFIVEKYNESRYRLGQDGQGNWIYIAGKDENTKKELKEPRMLNADGTDFLPPGSPPIKDKYQIGPRIPFGAFLNYLL